MPTVLHIGNQINLDNDHIRLKFKHIPYSQTIRSPLSYTYDVTMFEFNTSMTYRQLYAKLNKLGILNLTTQTAIYFERPDGFGQYKEHEFDYYHDAMRGLFDGSTQSVTDLGTWHKIKDSEIDNLLDHEYLLIINNDLFVDKTFFHPDIKKFLSQLIYSGHYTKALAMINSGYFEGNQPVNQTLGNADIMYLNALCEAIVFDRLDLVQAIYELCLNMGVLTNLYFAIIANYDYYQLYDAAAKFASDELIDYLLDKFPIYRSTPGKGASVSAVEYKSYSMLSFLLKRSNSLPSVYNRANFFNLMKRIVETPYDYFDTINMEEENLLRIAIDEKDKDMIMFLLDYHYQYTDDDVNYAEQNSTEEIARLIQEYVPMEIKEPDMY